VLLERALAEVAARAGAAAEQPAHPLLAARTARRAEIVLVTSDRGLAGAFNSNVQRRGQRFITENADRYEEVRVTTIGRKARDYFKNRKVIMQADYAGVHQKLRFEKAQEIAEDLTARWLAGETDAVFLCYNEFKNAISQNVVVRQLLPVENPAPTEAQQSTVDFLYEPAREQLLADLLPRNISMQVWRALLESAASEHGARMTAMSAATQNAEDMIAKLTLDYNRARQAYITTELTEIVSGAEALK
jgi:F-type H+-transporting ATPase subunit gamma